MRYGKKRRGMREVLQRLAVVLFCALISGGWGISADTPVSQAAQTREEMKQGRPTGGVDGIKQYRVGAEAAEKAPSYDNRLSFFGRTVSVFEAGTGDYGYNRLSDNQKAFYMSLEISLKNFESSEEAEFTEAWDGRYTPFKVNYSSKNLDGEQAGQVWTAFWSDHPWLFWLRDYMISYDESGEYLLPEVADEYKNDLSRIKSIYAMIEDGVSDYLDAAAGAENTYEKVRIIYDRIIRNADYAYQSDGTTPETANWAHSIVGVFDNEHKSAVCEGYAKTFSFLMNILDIPSIYIVGTAESNGSGGHAWNAVSFDGGSSYYYVDATWDDTGEKNSDQPENLYIYFAMPKSVFEKNHFADGLNSMYWQYDLPGMEDNMERTFFRTYGAYGTKEAVLDVKSANEFLKRAGALSPEQGRLLLLVDTAAYNKIQGELGGFWWYSYGAADGYKVIWAELPESVRVAVPAEELTLSPTEISIDMNMESRPASVVQIISVTENSDDYIRIYSSNEKVVTVSASSVKAQKGEYIYLVEQGEGEAAIYAKSAVGGVTASCRVVVREAVLPAPTATITPTSTPAEATATPEPTNTPETSPTENPGSSPTTQPLPTVKPTQKPAATAIPEPTNTPDTSPTENPGSSPTIQPLSTVKPTQTPAAATSTPAEATASPEPTNTPETSSTATPLPTSVPGPDKQFLQPTPAPSATAFPNPDETGISANAVEKRLTKGDSFVAGDIKYRVTKLKGKKGEAAVVGVKSKKSKRFVIPQKVKKEGITFSVTSIQKNAFQGCKKAKTLMIKSTSIRGITKKAMAGLVKRIQIRIPKSKAAWYRGVLRKFGYSKVTW